MVPSPGRIGPLNGFPSTISLSPDNQYAAIMNDGYGSQASQSHQSIAIINLKTNELNDFPETRLPEEARQSYFLGLAFSSDGNHLYASIGSITDPLGGKARGHRKRDRCLQFSEWEDQLGTVHKNVAAKNRSREKNCIRPSYIRGRDCDSLPRRARSDFEPDGPDKLLVANNYSDNVVLLDSVNGAMLQRFDLSTHQMIPSSFPYTVVATHDGRRAWCSLWNASRVAELDLEHGTIVRWISLREPKDPTAPGSHPTALLLSPDEKLLYVALTNADQVAVVDTSTGNQLHLLSTSLPGQKSAGTSPSALAQSEDGKRLFVADSALNAVEVIDTSTANGIESDSAPSVLGFIPTDWYPTTLAIVRDDLLIATAKGQGTGPNNGPAAAYGPHHRKHPYIASLLYGSISRINFRTAETHLPGLTRQVQESNLMTSDPGTVHFQQGSNPIKHVIYILKENRTYDQVLGDLKIGNGDPSLTLYGADITPNEHKLALQFGVLDNFYDSGEVSGDGHDWSSAAITTDYNEKTWQITYRSKERTYDYRGMIADEFPLDEGEPDVDAPATGYIWDNLASHGLSYRDYGDYIGTVWCRVPKRAGAREEATPPSLSAQCTLPLVKNGDLLPSNVGQPHGSISQWPWPIPLFSGGKATKALLRGHFDALFPDFNTEYPDQLRADEFLNEFGGFVQAHAKGNASAELPSFVYLYLPNDHTHGTTAGAPRPAASVADNDLAVGRVVEAVSHSPYWNDTAIFVIEDDAQDGADHVDAHRSTAFVISKYSPGSAAHPFVDSRFYTTVNMMHTMETLLGLPPMNQNDAYAPVMAPFFAGPGTQPAYAADWSNRDNGLIYQMNPPHGPGAATSAKLDFTRPDANNPAVLNAILWRDRKGNSPMPAPKHAVFVEPKIKKSKPDND